MWKRAAIGGDMKSGERFEVGKVYRQATLKQTILVLAAGESWDSSTPWAFVFFLEVDDKSFLYKTIKWHYSPYLERWREVP
jgi:hypothetical protein